MSSWSPQRNQSPGGLSSHLSRTLFLLLLSVVSAQDVTPNRDTCLVFHSINGSSVSCHPPAKLPHRLPADTVYLVVEFFNLTQLRADTLQGASNLQELHLSTNQLESLSPKFLLPVPLLKVLDLTRNALTRLPPGLFRVSAALHTLVLKENRLEILEPSWLQGLQALGHLDLSGNRLQMLPPGLLANFTSLHILDLSNNQLKTLPPDLLWGPLQLERLHLEGNRLQVLGEGLLSPQPDLRYLFLNDNRLATVAAGAFQGLRQLDMLDLSNNLLTGVPKGLWTSLGQPTRDMKEGFDISEAEGIGACVPPTQNLGPPADTVLGMLGASQIWGTPGSVMRNWTTSMSGSWPTETRCSPRMPHAALGLKPRRARSSWKQPSPTEAWDRGNETGITSAQRTPLSK